MKLPPQIVKILLEKMTQKQEDEFTDEILEFAEKLERFFVKYAKENGADKSDGLIALSLVLGAHIGGAAKDSEAIEHLLKHVGEIIAKTAKRTHRDGAFMAGGKPTPGCRCEVCEKKRMLMRAEGIDVEDLPELPFKVGDIVNVVDPLDETKIIQENATIENIVNNKVILSPHYVVGIDSIRPTSSK
jgi:hypothetical protein